RLPGLDGRRRDDEGGEEGRAVHALPPRAPRRGSRQRGDRREAERGLGRSREPAAYAEGAARVPAARQREEVMFGVADYWAFVAAVIVFLAIPGVGNLAIITSTGKGRIAGGLAATLGVIVGDQVLMWLAVAGVAALLTAYPAAFHGVQWLGAAYLAWLGGRMLFAKPGAKPVLDIKPHHYLRQALLITLLNPKAIVFYMAFFPL